MTRAGGGAGGAGPWLIAGAGAVLTVLAVYAIGGGDDGTPLSPTSDDRLGTSALVQLADEIGADVDVDDRLPDLVAGGPDVIVLFADLLDDEQRVQVDDWVDRGGRLVVTDPGSRYTPEVIAEFTDVADLARDRTLEGGCAIDALDELDVADVEPRNGGVLYAQSGAAEACVHDVRGGAYIVATPRGSGTVVAVGGAGMFVNAALAEGENAAVATALVAPAEGTELLVLEPGALAGASGQETLVDLIPAGVGRALIQLAVGFTLYALWRARRLGRPVAEPQPVAVAGSELVAAVGNLLDRTRTPDHAARVLRDDLRRFLADHLGLPAATPYEVVATVAADRTGVDEATLRWALGPVPVTDDGGLVALARTIDRIRTEVLTHV